MKRTEDSLFSLNKLILRRPIERCFGIKHERGNQGKSDKGEDTDIAPNPLIL